MSTSKKIRSMAIRDAARYADVLKVADEIANKTERLTGYADAFDRAVEKIDFTKHFKEMNRLRDNLDKMELSLQKGHKGKMLIAVAAVGGLFYIAERNRGKHETENAA